MKRIYNLAAALLITSAVCGQKVYDPNQIHTNPFPTVDLEEQYQKLLEQKKAKQKVASEKAAFGPFRVSHADERINEYFGTTTNYVIPMLPDSVATQSFTNSGTRGVQSHAIGGIFDPTSEDFTRNNLGVASRDTYTVDTIWVAFAYSVVNPTVTDTFRVHVFVADSSSNSAGYGELFLVQTAPYPGAPVRSIRFTSNGNHGVQAFPSAPGDTVIDRVLTLNDTSSFIGYLPIPTGGIEVLPGNLLGFFAYYVPGGPWTSADIYWEQNGNNETMNAFASYGTQEDVNADDFFAYDPTSFGSTHTLFNEGRYQISSTTFINDQVPPLLSSTNWVDFTYRGDNTTVGVEDYNSNSFLGTNYPNPFNEVTNIKYTINTKTSVQFEVTDITGKVVLSQNEGIKSAGNYKIQLNADAFNTGIYYYTLITNTGRITKKMIVVE